jgi:hypothetical protein
MRARKPDTFKTDERVLFDRVRFVITNFFLNKNEFNFYNINECKKSRINKCLIVIFRFWNKL